MIQIPTPAATPPDRKLERQEVEAIVQKLEAVTKNPLATLCAKYQSKSKTNSLFPDCEIYSLPDPAVMDAKDYVWAVVLQELYKAGLSLLDLSAAQNAKVALPADIFQCRDAMDARGQLPPLGHRHLKLRQEVVFSPAEHWQDDLVEIIRCQIKNVQNKYWGIPKGGLASTIQHLKKGQVEVRAPIYSEAEIRKNLEAAGKSQKAIDKALRDILPRGPQSMGFMYATLGNEMIKALERKQEQLGIRKPPGNHADKQRTTLVEGAFSAAVHALDDHTLKLIQGDMTLPAPGDKTPRAWGLDRNYTANNILGADLGPLSDPLDREDATPEQRAQFDPFRPRAFKTLADYMRAFALLQIRELYFEALVRSRDTNAQRPLLHCLDKGISYNDRQPGHCHLSFTNAPFDPNFKHDKKNFLAQIKNVQNGRFNQLGEHPEDALRNYLKTKNIDPDEINRAYAEAFLQGKTSMNDMLYQVGNLMSNAVTEAEELAAERASRSRT